MWKKIYSYFKKYPAQQKFIHITLSYGLSIKNEKIYCGNIELSPSKIARALNIDRRAILNAVKIIDENEELKNFFSYLKPTANFKEVAGIMEWGVIEIIPQDASMPGILADISKIIATENISIRQAVVDDYIIAEEPRLYIITEKPLSGRIINKIRKSKGVKGVITY